MNFDYLKKVILGEHQHNNYVETVKIADHVSFHANGYEYDWYGERSYNALSRFDYNSVFNYKGNIWFDIIVGQYRPQENKDDEAYEYRMKIYRCITKSTCSSVITEFEKIPRSSDWGIKFPEDAPPQATTSLKDYLHDYPKWGTFQNFVQQVLVKQICLDPNQIIAVLPEVLQSADDRELENPVTYFFPSRQVLDYKEGSHAIVFEEESKEYWIFEKEALTRYKINEKDGKKALILVGEYKYKIPLKTLNAKKTRGIFKKDSPNSPLFDSFLSPMLPYLDKAARESSDLDAATVRAMFPQIWQIKGMACRSCNGTGKVQRMGQPTNCSNCDGVGSVINSPSQSLVVDPARLGEQQVPIPPKGFIEPSTAILELQKSSIKDHKYDALASINLHFLDKTPLTESGKAKEVDRDSLNNSIYKVAVNLVDNIEFIIEATNDIRYQFIPKETRDKMLPSVAIPTDYSIITDAIYLEEFKEASTAGASKSTLREMEIAFLSKKYRNDPEQLSRSTDYILLNPLYGMNGSERGAALMHREIEIEDAITSTYIIDFVDRAYEEHSNFKDLETAKKKEIIRGYASEKVPKMEPNLEDEEMSFEGS